MMTRVALIEPHPLMRLGLHQVLTTLPGQWDVCVIDPNRLTQEAPSKVDILLFGLQHGDDPEWALLKEAQSRLGPEKILLLAESAESWSTVPHGIEGLYGCIAKTAPVGVLEAAIHLGMAGGQCFPPGDQRADLPHGVHAFDAPSIAASTAPLARAPEPDWRNLQALPARADLPPARPVTDPTTGAQLLNLTPRQYEVLKLLARGYPIKTVSRTLNISTATAKAHASTLYQRLRVNSKGEAVYAARQRGVMLD